MVETKEGMADDEEEKGGGGGGPEDGEEEEEEEDDVHDHHRNYSRLHMECRCSKRRRMGT